MARSLDGVWEFFPGEHELAELNALEPEPIRVPGLWEAQGHLDLDGVAWYRRRFTLDDAAGYWTLRFGAVMDLADVYVNGTLVGRHESAFTPFELDVSRAVVRGANVVAVRVTDPPLGDPDHSRTAHGKQGWNSQGFPSRPSLYMTYGGIWQPVTLHRHGPVVARDVFVNADPHALAVSFDVRNRSDEPQHARVRVETLAIVREADVLLDPRSTHGVSFSLGGTDAARWRPDAPVLHELHARVTVDGDASDEQTVRYGLRTIRVDGRRITIDGEPYRMKSALVQGFRADELYAEGDRDAILEEVLAAKAAGFNTLRLHIKAFDPTYLDVCDEVGMLLHCDIPIAEPLNYDEVGADTVLAQRCVAAAREQVVRDRNHPSVVLWSAMNEICDTKREARHGVGYEHFVRAVVGAIRDADPTRPVIENDWVEFDRARTFVSPILTAHWYGRLDRDWFDKVERKARRWRDSDRVLLVTEFGEWGLPEMPEVPEPPFWDTRELVAAGVATSAWPGTVERFVEETQRYQGVVGRLLAEIFRRNDHLSGYCLTELTDVPHELNGLLDIHRRPKRAAVEELTRANQVVLPMAALDAFVVAAGEEVRAPLHVANDGAALREASIAASFASAQTKVLVAELPAHAATGVGELALEAPAEPGAYDLVLRLAANGRTIAENRYALRVVERPRGVPSVCLLGGGATAAALEGIGAPLEDSGVIVVAERALDAQTGAELRARLDDGATALVLAQTWDAWPYYPLRMRLDPWVSIYHFTTARCPLSALPRGHVLVAEDATIQPRSIFVDVGGAPFPDEPAVVAYKAGPRPVIGTVVGSHGVGRGRLVFCQYRVSARAAAGDAAAQAVLADLVRWAAEPRAVDGVGAAAGVRSS